MVTSKENGWRVVLHILQTLGFFTGLFYMFWVFAQGVDLFMKNNGF